MKSFYGLRAIVSAVAMVCLCVFAGCSSANSDQASIPVFDVEHIMDNIETINLSEYASDINYYPLETSENSLVNGSIITNKIVPTSKGVIFFIPNSSNVPMAFDHNGKFISKIGTAGRTSSEYLQLFNVLAVEDGVELVDCNKIMVYDDEYNFVSSFPIELNLGEICKTNSGNYISLVSNYLVDKHIKVLDKSGNVLRNKTLNDYMPPKAPEADENETGEIVVSSFKAVEEKCRFFNVAGDPCIYFTDQKDTVYTVLESGEMAERYLINYGKYNDGVNLNMFIYETDKMILSRFMFKFNKYPNIDQKYRFLYFVYDKSTGTTRGMKVADGSKEAAFKNDIDGGIEFFPKAIGNGKMYQLVSAIKFIDAANASNSAKMKEVAATLTEESNPVLVVATLK